MNLRHLIVVFSLVAATLSGAVFAGSLWNSKKQQEALETRTIRLQQEAWEKERHQVLVLLWGEKIWADDSVKEYLSLCEPSRIITDGEYQIFYHGHPRSSSRLKLYAKSGKLIAAYDCSCNHYHSFFDRRNPNDKMRIGKFDD